MSKERRTVSLDEDVDEFLGSEGVNASELVNKLVKNHASAGGDKQSMLELREEQLKSDISSLEGRVESKREELEAVQEQLSQYRDKREDRLQEAAESVKHVVLEPGNPAVENWAAKLDMTEREFIQQVEEYLPE